MRCAEFFNLLSLIFLGYKRCEGRRGSSSPSPFLVSIGGTSAFLHAVSLVVVMRTAEGVRFSHIARESSNVKRLADFYQEVDRRKSEKSFIFFPSATNRWQLKGFSLLLLGAGVREDRSPQIRAIRGDMAQPPLQLLLCTPSDRENSPDQAPGEPLQRQLIIPSVHRRRSPCSPQGPSPCLIRLQFRLFGPNPQGKSGLLFPPLLCFISPDVLAS